MIKRSLPSPAMVVACIALFVALGGTGYAATQISTENDEAIASKSKVKRGPRGPRGPRGLQGLPGPQGAPGLDAFGQLDYNVGGAVVSKAGEQVGVVAHCDPGFHAVGGGVFNTSEKVGQSINSSYPSDGTGDVGTTAWVGFVDNETEEEQESAAFVICARAATVTGF